MAAWRNATRSPTASTSGVLRPELLARHAELDRFPAGDRVGRWVENHWTLRWDLPAGTSFLSQVLPHPTTTLTVELGSHRRPGLDPAHDVFVTGVVTRRFDVDVQGWGHVVGVRFRPGGLAALTGLAASAWKDRTVPAVDVLPPALCEALADPDVVRDPPAWAAAAEQVLLELAPEDDPAYDELVGVVADMLADRELLTVTDVCARHGFSTRSLQRLFLRYVGVGPKWVLARYRMHDVVSAIDAGDPASLTDLARRYGWYDQAHFTREFKALVGVTPSAYRDRR